MTVSQNMSLVSEAEWLRDTYFPDLGQVIRPEQSDIALYTSILRRRAHLEQDAGARAERLLFATGAEALLSTGNLPMSHFLAEAMAMNMTRQAVSNVIKSLNHAFVYEKNLEITSHGIVRSFRFWNEDEKKEYIKFSQELKIIIQQDFPLVCLGYGFVLSFVRQQGFMPHDDDVDLIVALDPSRYKTITSGINALTAYLQQKGLIVWGEWSTHRKVTSPNGAYDVDVFVGYSEGDFVSFMPGPRRTIRHDTIFPALEVPFLDSSCAIPRNPFVYLRDVYGPDWFQPIPGWQHSWKEEDYADLIEKED